jgi:hypothetical protein
MTIEDDCGKPSAAAAQFTLVRIDIPPPGARTRGLGWAEVFILLQDASLNDARPLVSVEVPVAYDDDCSFRKARQAVLDRARAILAAAADNLGRTTLEALETIPPDQSP